MRTIRRILAVAAVLVQCCVPVFAQPEAEQTAAYSPRFTAIAAAQQALAEKYGITEDMNDYFVRVTRETGHGGYEVTWYPDPGHGYLHYLLGTYTAVMAPDGQVSVTWSLDGQEADDSLASLAWGPAQLRVVMEEVRTEYEYADSVAAAKATVESAGYALSGGIDEAMYDDGYEETDEVMETVYTQDDLERIAKAAIADQYPDVKSEHLTYWDYEYPASVCLLYGRPVAVLNYGLWGYQGSDGTPWSWHEGDGYYRVTINLENGSVEEILHTSGLAGNG